MNSVQVAGTQYYQAAEVIDEMQTAENRTVVLKREPENQYDDRAIEVITASGIKLGYVPRQYNKSIANLMDSGFHVSGHITRFTAHGNSADIRLELLLMGRGEEPELQDAQVEAMEDNQVIPMIGGIRAEVDHSTNILLLNFG